MGKVNHWTLFFCDFWQLKPYLRIWWISAIFGSFRRNIWKSGQRENEMTIRRWECLECKMRKTRMAVVDLCCGGKMNWERCESVSAAWRLRDPPRTVTHVHHTPSQSFYPSFPFEIVAMPILCPSSSSSSKVKVLNKKIAMGFLSLISAIVAN